MGSVLKDASSGLSLERAVKLMLVAFVLMTIGLAAFYVIDRYRYQNVSIVDREMQRLEELARRDPENLAARLAVADAYFMKKRYDQAITQYEQVLKADPDRVGTLIGLGFAYRGKGDIAKMEEAFKHAIEVSTGDFAQFDARLQMVNYYLGEAYLKHGEYDQSIERLQAALKIKRTDADALLLLGHAYQGKGEYGNAAGAYATATEFVPDFVEAYQGMAASFEKMGDAARAGYARGMVAFSKGDNAGALRQLEEAASQATDEPIVVWGLAMAREKAGQKERAVEAYRRMLTLAPDYRPAIDALARLGAN
ncbi:MAG: tetratricopeptide repeat protein [Chloroflexota bacterium]|nr:MAG: tetratricopeptide repeat protein [Chloroflexota bacterium]